MPIQRSSDQRNITLEEFYTDLIKTSTNYYTDVGKEMLPFIQLINEMFKETIIWGLTSHARLVLQNADDSQSDWFVIIDNIGTKDYYFEYLMPSDKKPWENAYVRGQASSLDEAKSYLLIAMNESQGWSDNVELDQLLKEHLNSLDQTKA